jgi:glycosyltransferase involved in cell wall biosynthesis
MPRVSVIVPCYNEVETIGKLLDALARQTFPLQDIEVIIADGLSSDGTRGLIADYRRSDPSLEIRVIENPKRAIPCGLNLALEAARGDFIVRLDAHSIPYPDYLSLSTAALEAGVGENVGGVWEIRPSGNKWIARSIAAAAAHPIGVGDARYRSGGEAGEVDTVPFGAFRRAYLSQLGGYDESLLTNEDYELNVRIRKAGGRIWLDPRIRSIYFPRASLPLLARQYWRYGYWKARMLKKHPETIRWRQMAAILVLSLSGLAVLSIWFAGARPLLAAELILYGVLLVISGIQTGLKQRDLALVVGVPLAIATMHFSWGTAFLWSIAQSLVRR